MPGQAGMSFPRELGSLLYTAGTKTCHCVCTVTSDVLTNGPGQVCQFQFHVHSGKAEWERRNRSKTVSTPPGQSRPVSWPVNCKVRPTLMVEALEADSFSGPPCRSSFSTSWLDSLDLQLTLDTMQLLLKAFSE